MRRSRRILFGLLSVCLSVALCLLTLEVALRFLPVESGLRTRPVTLEDPVFRATPNIPYVYSKAWNFLYSNTGQVNNAGFVNEQDYTASGPRPLIAVIGDSYMEALMVPYSQTVHGRLSAMIGSRGRVYSFAFSGAPLSQYLVWARHAREQYRPDAVIVSVVGNDFDESLLRYGRRPGFHHYAQTESGTLELRLVPYQPSLIKRAARHSALARYIALNLHASSAVRALAYRTHDQAGGGNPESPEYVGNTAAERSADVIRDSLGAIDAFLRDLPDYSGLPADRILFVVDGRRNAIYRPAQEAASYRSYFGVMRRAFIERARAQQYAVIDLHEVFAAKFAIQGKRFEFEEDAHWSAYGHAVVAEAIAESDWFKGLAPTP